MSLIHITWHSILKSYTWAFEHNIFSSQHSIQHANNPPSPRIIIIFLFDSPSGRGQPLCPRWESEPGSAMSPGMIRKGRTLRIVLQILILSTKSSTLPTSTWSQDCSHGMTCSTDIILQVRTYKQNCWVWQFGPNFVKITRGRDLWNFVSRSLKGQISRSSFLPSLR